MSLSGEKPLQGVSVLIVEDDDDFRDCVAELLRRAAATVMTASRGEAAIDIVAEFAPNVVLIDQHMPGMNGTEVASYLLAREHCPAIILISAAGDVHHLAKEIGAHHALEKPFTAGELAEAVLLANHAVGR